MSVIKRIGVFLNGSPADVSVLEHTQVLTKVCGADRLLFFHIRQRSRADRAPDPSPEKFQEAILTACPQLDPASLDFEIIPASGVRAILGSIRKSDLGLVVVGRRLPTDQLAIGSTYTRLARKAPCHVMVITEYSYPHLERFLVPIDFTEHSRLSIATALDLIRHAKLDHPQIVLHHNVEVSYGYQYTGATLEEAIEGQRTRAEMKIKEFIEGIDFKGIDLQCVVTSAARAEEAITALAIARKMDVVVMGSHGQESIFGTLLGDTAERTLAQCPLPVLVTKKREDAERLLDMILKGEAG